MIADLGSHVFDLIEHLAGPIARLTAVKYTAYATRPSAADPATRVSVDGEDAVVLLAQLQSGAVGTLEATKIATGREDELRCEVDGSRGALRFNLMDPHHLEFFDATGAVAACGAMQGWTRINTGQRYEAPATTFPSPKAPIGWLRAHVACLANFLQAVASGQGAQPDLRQGIRVQQLMHAAQNAARTGQWVDVPR